MYIGLLTAFSVPLRLKPEFRAAFWATVILNVAGFVTLCSPVGRAYLKL
jgi:hypothetical protein